MDLQAAKLLAMCWTLKAMAAHRFDNVVIAGEDPTLLKLIERPRPWPSFASDYHHPKFLLGYLCGWKSLVETRSSNRCTFLIAKSAQKVQWGQSYVARGAP
ncbi:hypothetical protein F2Q70_00004676 [Brassica cretica]|uniref:Uncharacterized protein n=1 Tax=Brassica cretica TaxID=69181 RepID=A0A8S9IXH8_BRACR|nr:hypothetical protein F2Q70_00004676 [Brassica cretica]